MLSDLIIGVFTFRQGIYASVERDTTFTQTAWILVTVVAFLNQLGSSASTKIFDWAISTIVGTLFVVLGFALAALTISWLGKTLFNADVTFDELVRTLGLAYVWNIVGVFGVLTAFIPFLNCLIGPIAILAWLLGLLAWFIAAKEALDLEWVQTIITVLLGWLVLVVVMAISGGVLTLVGVTARAAGGLF